MTETNWGEVFDQECGELVCRLTPLEHETADEFENRVDAWWASEALVVQRSVEERRDEARRLKYSIERDAEKARQDRAADEYKASQPRGLW